MTVALINGNPETPRIWDQLAPLLVDHVIVRIGLPGFGVDPPATWNATLDEYIDYVASELAALDHPVHVLGHDVGGLLALMVAARRPEILTSVAADTFGSFSADYQWHPLAQIWQTAGDGERCVAQRAALPVGERVRVMVERGMPERAASALAPAFDDEMARCILALYRSAAQPRLADEGRRVAHITVPALAILAELDTVTGSAEQHRSEAARVNASVLHLPGVGHWWMAERPDIEAPGLLTARSQHPRRLGRVDQLLLPGDR